MPLTAGAEHEAEGIQRLPILAAGPMAPQGRRCARRQPWLEALPPRVSETPILVGSLLIVLHAQGSCRRDLCPPEDRYISLLG